MMKNIWRGVCIGITETVPGVSGSTVAMILGIYEKLVYSISLLSTNKRREALPFLATLGLGMIIGFSLSVYSINLLLKSFPAPTMMFFVGIIVGFLPYLWKEATRQSNNNLHHIHYVIIGLCFSVVVIIQLLSGTSNIAIGGQLSVGHFVFLFVAGFIASTALVLPGMSGALILKIFGIYYLAIESIMTFYLSVILPIIVGVLSGVLLTSKFVRLLLVRFTLATYAAMIGMIAGSVFAIMYQIANQINRTIDLQMIVTSSFTFIVGVGIIIILKRSQAR